MASSPKLGRDPVSPTLARRLTRLLTAVGLALTVITVLSVIPTPYVLRAPGKAQDVAPMIQIPLHQQAERRGKLLLTTVILEPASALYCLYALMDPQAELLAGGRREAAATVQDDQMDRSQYLAKVAALLYLGYQLKPQAQGARVLGLLPESRAQGLLVPGDLIVEANGRPVRRAEDLSEEVARLAPGRTLHLMVRRGDESLSVETRTYQTSLGGHNRRLLGVQLRTDLQLRELPVEIDIQAGNVSGASAGLMFALGIADRLGTKDLTRDRIVAGTGTIDAGGQVGPVFGAGLKVVAAQRAGARLFLCPEENVVEARAAKTSLRVIPVRSLRQAVEALTTSDD